MRRGTANRSSSGSPSVTSVIGLTRAVGDWLAMLGVDQRQRATFRFDDPDRFVWAFTPGERRGLALGDMDPSQQDAAMAIVAAAMSARGAREVGEIMALETILGEIERDEGRSNWSRRDPGLYWFAVFGEPTGPDPWMWRVGGHHVVVNRTVAGSMVIAASPSLCALARWPACGRQRHQVQASRCGQAARRRAPRTHDRAHSHRFPRGPPPVQVLQHVTHARSPPPSSSA